jgi:hypothetical protein
MVGLDELRALAAGTPPAPARVVTLDPACDGEGAGGAGGRIGRGARRGLPGHPAAERLLGRRGRGGALLEALAARLGGRASGWRRRRWRCRRGACPDEPCALARRRLCRRSAGLRAAAVRRAGGDPAPAAHAAGGGGETDARRWWARLLALAPSAPSVSLVPEAPGPGRFAAGAGTALAGAVAGLGELIPRRRAGCAGAGLRRAGPPVRRSPDDARRLAGRIVTMADELLGQLLGPGAAAPCARPRRDRARGASRAAAIRAASRRWPG